jgi:hypothetical protein
MKTKIDDKKKKFIGGVLGGDGRKKLTLTRNEKSFPFCYLWICKVCGLQRLHTRLSSKTLKGRKSVFQGKIESSTGFLLLNLFFKRPLK